MRRRYPADQPSGRRTLTDRSCLSTPACRSSFWPFLSYPAFASALDRDLADPRAIGAWIKNYERDLTDNYHHDPIIYRLSFPSSR